ncbi:MAG: CHASE3 domain-containing protein [Betaproteobacteria bacterium]|nr:CHASE3 domain-containing protein [Betaproteobacteria bacterium]MCC6248505.1 CHASE3 domain-containing protein [Rubrivivax sp.]MCL4697694.1 CHASE3 domain-containing protein [Burkholderiaceae bacterium]
MDAAYTAPEKTPAAKPLAWAWRSRLSYHLAGPLAVLLAAAVLATSEFGWRANADLVARRDAAVETRLTVGAARRMVLAAESAQRGYMLSGKPEYREPYDEAMSQAGPVMRSLQLLAQRAPAQRENLRLLTEATERRLSELSEVMRLFEAGDRQRALELMLTDIGREQMERIDTLVEEVVRREEAAAGTAGRQRERVRIWTVLALAALVLLCLGAVFTVVRLNRERDRERAAHVQDLKGERDKLEQEVTRRTQDLTALARHLQTVREDERRRLAREMHDELGGLLTAAKLDVARVKKRLGDASPEVQERITHLSQTLDAGIALKRRIIEDLSPSSLANLGLQRTLEIQCAEFSKRAEVQVRTDIADIRLTDERELAIYRFVQEALTNVAKYARARHVQVRVQPDGDHVCVDVRDDGVGFDPGETRHDTHGLAGMKFRVQSCGGQWLVQSTPGQGTLVQARLPL